MYDGPTLKPPGGVGWLYFRHPRASTKTAEGSRPCLTEGRTCHEHLQNRVHDHQYAHNWKRTALHRWTPTKVHVDDFKYLGSYVLDSMKDFNARKGMAWSACIKLQKVWTSGISEHLKVKFIRACVEPVLLYGSETWTMNKQFQKRLNGCYTRVLLKAKNMFWKKHPTLQQIYEVGDLPPKK